MAGFSLAAGSRPTPKDIWGWVARGDVVMALGVVAIILLLVLPIPSILIDVLLAISTSGNSPNILAAEAMRRMNDWKITSVFVVDNEKPVGILRMHDILRAGAL